MALVARVDLLLGAAIAWIIVALYQRHLSPRLRSGTRFAIICRFHPSCSEYARLALTKYGATLGVWKTIGRLRRCRPDNFDTCFDPPWAAATDA